MAPLRPGLSRVMMALCSPGLLLVAGVFVVVDFAVGDVGAVAVVKEGPTPLPGSEEVFAGAGKARPLMSDGKDAVRSPSVAVFHAASKAAPVSRNVVAMDATADLKEHADRHTNPSPSPLQQTASPQTANLPNHSPHHPAPDSNITQPQVPAEEVKPKSLSKRAATTRFQPLRDLVPVPESMANRRMDSAIRRLYSARGASRQQALRSRSSTIYSQRQQQLLKSASAARRLRSRLNADPSYSTSRLRQSAALSRASADSTRQRSTQQMLTNARLKRVELELRARLQKVNRLQEQVRNPSARPADLPSSPRQSLRSDARPGTDRLTPRRGNLVGRPAEPSLMSGRDSFATQLPRDYVQDVNPSYDSRNPQSSTYDAEDSHGTAELPPAPRLSSPGPSFRPRTFPEDRTMDEIIQSAYNTRNGDNAYRYLASRLDSNGFILTGLDMKLTAQQYSLLQPEMMKRKRRKALNFAHWPGGVIPYHIATEYFEPHDIRIIHWAMDQWQKYTCVTFRPATASDRNRIVFQDGIGCSSNIGMARGEQFVTLQRECRRRKIVLHELGHVLGLIHEHQRPDRDRYIAINYPNIRPGGQKDFAMFPRSSVRDYGVTYDFTSVMHYGPTDAQLTVPVFRLQAFSRSPALLTMVTKDPTFQDIIGTGDMLSPADIETANRMYNCGSKGGIRPLPMDNRGILPGPGPDGGPIREEVMGVDTRDYFPVRGTQRGGRPNLQQVVDYSSHSPHQEAGNTMMGDPYRSFNDQLSPGAASYTQLPHNSRPGVHLQPQIPGIRGGVDGVVAVTHFTSAGNVLDPLLQTSTGLGVPTHTNLTPLGNPTGAIDVQSHNQQTNSQPVYTVQGTDHNIYSEPGIPNPAVNTHSQAAATSAGEHRNHQAQNIPSQQVVILASLQEPTIPATAATAQQQPAPQPVAVALQPTAPATQFTFVAPAVVVPTPAAKPPTPKAMAPKLPAMPSPSPALAPSPKTPLAPARFPVPAAIPLAPAGGVRKPQQTVTVYTGGAAVVSQHRAGETGHAGHPQTHGSTAGTHKTAPVQHGGAAAPNSKQAPAPNPPKTPSTNPGDCRQLLPAACMVHNVEALRIMHGEALVNRCLSAVKAICEVI